MCSYLRPSNVSPNATNPDPWFLPCIPTHDLGISVNTPIPTECSMGCPNVLVNAWVQVPRLLGVCVPIHSLPIFVPKDCRTPHHTALIQSADRTMLNYNGQLLAWTIFGLLSCDGTYKGLSSVLRAC